MIYGIGTDLTAVSRIAQLHQKHGTAFIRRILSEEEQQEFPNAARPDNYLAKRFAAKEAFAKSVGTGIRGEVSFRNITVTHDAAGKPGYRFAPSLQQWLDERNIRTVHLSLSDEGDTVSAFAVAEQYSDKKP